MKKPVRSELVEDFDRLETMVVEAVSAIGRLKDENRELSRRLDESERRRKVATDRLDALLNRLEKVAL